MKIINIDKVEKVVVQDRSKYYGVQWYEEKKSMEHHKCNHVIRYRYD